MYYKLIDKLCDVNKFEELEINTHSHELAVADKN